jgi:hypothetical protein
VTDANGDLLVSFRYMNAIYKVTNPASSANAGRIIWKLGGSASATEPGTRLTVSGDPAFSKGGLGLGGQHYPRYFNAGDGNLYVTLHDNSNDRGRPPRGVRYRLNEGGMTATLVEDVRDIASPNMTAYCCGSALKLPGGNWVMSWGGNPLVTELTPSGARVFVLTFSAFSYRVEPVLPGLLTREQLRAGMDAQYPRLANRAPVANSQSVTAQSGVPRSVTLSASDPDGQPLSYQVVTGPAHGTLTGTGAGRTYTATSGYIGPDSFTFRVNDGYTDSNLATVSITVTAAPVAGSLSGSFSTPSGTQNLSTLGVSDWAHWGLNTTTSYNHKAGVTAQISNYTTVGSAFTSRHTTHPFGFSWTGGTPTASATNTMTGLSRSGTGAGFRITAPAGLEQRTLYVFVGVRSGARGRLVAQLSDGSAPTYTETSFTSSGTAGRLYRLIYRAGSAGRTLTVTFTRDNSLGSVTLEGAALGAVVP